MSVNDIGRVMAETSSVHEVHDLHVSSLCTGQVSLSAHSVPNNRAGISQVLLLMDLNRRLRERFGIEHTTIQIEPSLQVAQFIPVE